MPSTLGLHRLHCHHPRRGRRVHLLTCWALFATLPLGSCGGGDGTPPTYSIGGTVSGLDAGQSTILYNNGGDGVTVSANGAFTFVTKIASGGAYDVTVTAPAGKTCTVTGGSGTVSAPVTDVAVTCVSNATLAIGGTIFVGDFFFVANSNADSISAFSIDATSGALLAVGPPVAAVRGPTAMASTSDNSFLYVANSLSNDVSAFAVNAVSGALTPVTGSPFAAGTNPTAIAVFTSSACSSRGWPCWTIEFLYVTNSASNTVSAYQIDSRTGVLTPLPPFATGPGPSAMAAGPGAPYTPFLYVANTGGSHEISAFSIDGLSGGLRPIAGSPFPSNGDGSSLAFGTGDAFQYPPGSSNGSPGFKGLLYAANASGSTASIMGFSIHPPMGDANDGALTALPGFPYDLPSCSSVVADRTGTYLYATAGTNVFGFSIDKQTGALSPLPGSAAGVGDTADLVSIDPTDKFLYVTSRRAGTATGFRLNAATGELTPLPGSPFAMRQ